MQIDIHFIIRAKKRNWNFYKNIEIDKSMYGYIIHMLDFFIQKTGT